MPIGVTELLILLAILLLVFGARRIPEIGRSIGTGMREFKDSISGQGGEDSASDRDDGDEPRRRELTAPAAGASEDSGAAAGVGEPRGGAGATDEPAPAGRRGPAAEETIR